ncbi:MAG: hypothetical protein AAGA92_06910 [Planctomycetota bacterium]
MPKKYSGFVFLAITSVLGLICLQLTYTAKQLDQPRLDNPDIERAMQIELLQTPVY